MEPSVVKVLKAGQVLLPGHSRVSAASGMSGCLLGTLAAGLYGVPPTGLTYRQALDICHATWPSLMRIQVECPVGLVELVFGEDGKRRRIFNAASGPALFIAQHLCDSAFKGHRWPRDRAAAWLQSLLEEEP